jgi:hypothetical protein
MRDNDLILIYFSGYDIKGVFEEIALLKAWIESA